MGATPAIIRIRGQAHAPQGAMRLMMIANIAHRTQGRVDFVRWQPATGGDPLTLKWKITPDPEHSKQFSWLVAQAPPAGRMGAVTIGVQVKMEEPDRYFVSRKILVLPLFGVRNVSGCFKMADGVAHAWQANSGMSVNTMDADKEGSRGWCYHYKVVPGEKSIHGHFFAASSAASWAEVAAWYRRAFASVESRPSRSLDAVATSLRLGDPDTSDQVKTLAIRSWMKAHLSYSTSHSKAHIPNTFDAVLESHGGDCKDLVMVMVQLFHAAHIAAHPALTSMDDYWPFLQNSSNVGVIDHVVVYLPKSGRYIDPTTNDGRDAVYLSGRQAPDVETGQVLNVPKSISGR